MIYTTGSIAVSGNTLTGTGTNFTAAGSLIRNGCTVLALTSPAQAFQITSVDSATGLTVTPAASPAVPAGTKFAILLSDSLSVDGLAQDIAETFSMYQRYMGVFADVMSSSGDVTITINGQPVTVPGQQSLAKKGANSDITSLNGMTTALSIQQGGTGGKTAAEARNKIGAASSGNNSDITSITGLTTALGIQQGGTGGKTAAEARTNLGLSDVATKTAGTAEGSVMLVGAMGTPTGGYKFYKTEGAIAPTLNWNDITLPGLFPNLIDGSNSANSPTASGYYYAQVLVRGDSGAVQQIALPYATSASNPGRILYRGKNGNTWSSWAEFYTTANTTKASVGTVKAAAPIARIAADRKTCLRTDISDDGFAWCGCGTANGEAEGITISRLDTGVYVIAGSAGLASSGWQLLPPRDPQGSGDLGIVEAEETESGGLTIRLYKRRYVLSEDGDIELQKGAAIDVPPTSWIDVRLEMPETSLWNQRAAGPQEQ